MIIFIKNVLTVIGIFLLMGLGTFLLALPWILLDNKEEKEHLKFLSEKLGYEVPSYIDWCNERNLKFDDKTVRSAYRRYISNKEYEVKNMLV